MAIAGGIVTVVIALSILLGNIAYNLTGQIELQVAVIGAVVLVMSFLSYRIFKNA